MSKPVSSLYDETAKRMLMFDEVDQYPPSGDDLIIWPDGDSCSAQDLPTMGHKSKKYIRLSIDSETYDEISFAFGLYA